jgi:hypothetical protein
MWQYIEDRRRRGGLRRPGQVASKKPGEEIKGLPPRHYPEWDYHSQTYRPDWVSLYEALHPKGNPGDIDTHAGKARAPWQKAPEAHPRPAQAAGQGARALSGRRQRAGPRRRHPLADRLQGRRQPGSAHQHEPQAPDGRNIAVMLAARPVRIAQRKSQPAANRPSSNSARKPSPCWPGRWSNWATRSPSPASIPTPATTCATCTSRATAKAGATK